MNNEALTRFPDFQIPRNAPSSAQWTLRLLTKLQTGTLKVTTPEGVTLVFGDHSHPKANIQLKNWNVCSAALKSGDIGFAETYIAGDWKTDNLAALLGVFLKNRHAVEKVIYGSFIGGLAYKLKHWLNRNTKTQAKKNIHAHYDIGNSFYQLWLDPSMTYSSGLFKCQETQSLEEAQKEKYAAMLEFLQPSATCHLLEIGCGWGGFAEMACRRGANVTGLTLSSEQLAFAQNRLNEQGYGSKSSFKLQDYRDCQGLFDGIVSIEMFEAVGEAYWPAYFETLHARLKAKGRAAIQSIVISDELFNRYRKGTDFIQQYIFPGGMLPSRAIFEEYAEKFGLKVVSTLAFGKDYAETLRHWRKSFMTQLPQVKENGFDDTFIRTWEFYLAYCEAGFEDESTDVYQFYLEKK